MNLLVRANGQSSISIEYKRLSVHISVRTGYTISNTKCSCNKYTIPNPKDTKYPNKEIHQPKYQVHQPKHPVCQNLSTFFCREALFGLVLQVKRKWWCTKRDKHQVWNWPGLLLLASGLYGKVKRLHRLSPAEELCNNINKGSISLFSSIHLALQIC